jgi:hypothetical protein
MTDLNLDLKTIDSIELVERIISAPASARKRLINDFFSSRDSLFNRLSYVIARKFSAEHAREDIRQIIMIEAHGMITEAINDPELLEDIRSFEGLLQSRAHAKARTYLDRDDIGITNVTTIKRRQRMLMALREQMMIEAAGDVTDQDVVLAHNKNVEATRVNAKKQGMIATVEDMRHNFTAAAEEELASIVGATDNTNVDYLLHPMEGKKFIAEIIRRCDLVDPALGEFSRCWLEMVYLDGVAEPNERELAKQMGLSRPVVVRTINRMRAVALDALHEMMDIGEDDLLSA